MICGHPKKGRKGRFFCFKVLGEIPKFGRFVVNFLLENLGFVSFF